MSQKPTQRDVVRDVVKRFVRSDARIPTGTTPKQLRDEVLRRVKEIEEKRK